MPSQFGGVAIDDSQPVGSMTGSRFGGIPLDDSNRPSITQTIADQAAQGATFGFGDETKAAFGAGTDYVGKKGAQLLGYDQPDKSLGDFYNQGLQKNRQDLNMEMQDSPVTSIVSNLAGGLLTGGLGADTSAGSAITNSLRSGSLPIRALKGAGLGAASGAAFGFGQGQGDLGQRFDSAEQGAGIGALTGGAIPVAGSALSDVAQTGKNAVKGLLARSPEAVQNAAEALKDTASGIYDKMRSVGATLNPTSSQGLISSLDSAVAGNQFIPELNPKTLAIVNHIKQAANNGDLGLNDLDQYRRLLGKVGNSEDGVSAGSVRQAIDNHVNGLTGTDLSNGSTDAVDLLNQGRKQYQQASKFEDISDILTKADGDPNKIKSGLTRYLNNDKNLRGWSDDEISALKDAASNSGTEKLLKLGGKFGLDLGTSLTPGNTVAPIVGGALGGIAAPIAGTGARITQKLTARAKAESLLNTIENGSNGSVNKPISSLLAAPAANALDASPAQQIQVQPQTMPTTSQSNTQNPDLDSFMQKEAKAESNNNPNAQSKTSSASGLFGFTNKTWAQMVGKYGKETGIDLADKNDPKAQAIMAKKLALDNIDELQGTLGRTPTTGELYMAHFLGANGAAKLINADPNKEAIMLFPRNVLDANRSIFFDGKQPRTAGEVYKLLASKVS